MEPREARNLIPIAGHYIHMNHAGVSPMSDRVRAAIEQVVESMTSRPYREHWAQEEADRVRELIGQLINAEVGGLAARHPAFGAALELLIDVGPDVIEARVLELSGKLGTGLVERGYEVVEPWPRGAAESSGIVSFRKPGASAQEVLRDLTSAHVVARIHRDFVRLSPHFYNTDEEVERVLGVLEPESVNR